MTDPIFWRLPRKFKLYAEIMYWKSGADTLVFSGKTKRLNHHFNCTREQNLNLSVQTRGKGNLKLEGSPHQPGSSAKQEELMNALKQSIALVPSNIPSAWPGALPESTTTNPTGFTDAHPDMLGGCHSRECHGRLSRDQELPRDFPREHLLKMLKTILLC